MNRNVVYMDYQATTPVDPRVVDAMVPFFTEKFGNPASRQHQFGWIAEQAVESARGTIGRSIGAESNEIVFTSGSTESNNLAIKGIAGSMRQKGNHIITVQTEHRSVLDACRTLEKQGFAVTYLPVNDTGVIDLQQLLEAMNEKTILVSVMYANNEIGTIQDITEIGRRCREQGIVFHTDATQAVGKLPVNVQSMHIDLLSMSGHKIYGPKGVGALYVRARNPRVKPQAQMDGGGHEKGMRSGTLNVPSIVGMGKALSLCHDSMETEVNRLTMLRDRLWTALRNALDDIYLNGPESPRLPNNLNVSFLHVEDNALMMSMKDIAVSTGSACSTADPQPSHVLKALHVPASRVHSAIRFGLGRFTTEEEIDYVICRVVENVKKLRELSPSAKRSREHILASS